MVNVGRPADATGAATTSFAISGNGSSLVRSRKLARNAPRRLSRTESLDQFDDDALGRWSRATHSANASSSGDFSSRSIRDPSGSMIEASQ